MTKERRVGGYLATRRRPSWGALLVVVVLHVGVLAGLIRAFAPDLPALAIEQVTSLVTVRVRIDEPPDPPPATPEPPPSPSPDEGAAAPEAPTATPRAMAAPKPAITLPRPIVAPPAASTGAEERAGAGEVGQGTGGGGEGAGTGSGLEGEGSGGIAAEPPVKIAGDISDARDYPVPPGGREIRRGASVIIHMTVGVDGRARDCRIIRPSPDPEADRITCRLAEERFRFRPARDDQGNAVPAIFGWRQDWF